MKMEEVSVLRAVPVGKWAIGYIERRVALASDYMKTLLNRCDLLAGSAFVYVSRTADTGRIRNLEQGGVAPGRIRSDGSIELSPAPLHMLARYLYKQLRRHAPALLLAEDLLCLPTDPCVEQVSPAIRVVYDEGLYYYARDDASLGQIEEVILGVDLAYPPALLVVAASPTIGGKSPISDILSTLPERGEVKTIVAGVYDGESFLVWNRKTS